MAIGDLKLGKIDAKNEVLRSGDRERFELSFLIPPQFPVRLFETREKFIVQGPKGSGKTALLRYLETKDRRAGHDTSFILFRNEFSEADKTEIKDLDSPVTLATVENRGGSGREYFQHWKLYLHGFIAQRLAVADGIVKRTVELDNYLQLLRGADKGRAFQFKGGSASLDLSMNPKLALKLDFEVAESDKQTLSDLISKADSSFKRLTPLYKRSLRIYFDELELSALDSSKRTRDAVLVRDLVRACEALNALSITNDIPVQICLAIRSDVVAIASATGMEINKIVEDHGSKISWSSKADVDGLHPLHQLLARRLQVANGAPPDPNAYFQTWNKYFPRILDGRPSRTYVLHQTWYKPRDVIRLLVTAAEGSPHERDFSEKVLLSARREYASRCWDELREELSVRYDKVAIDGIKQVLTGLGTHFTTEDLSRAMREKRASYPQINHLFDQGKTANALIYDLYRIGAVGNTGQNTPHNRWIFRDDEEPLLSAQFTLHSAIRPVLSARFA